ncbi:MAG: hypothetical protein GX621_12845 [Pirellulaceae bacterium]|nr:hypothetical protein [Pirellulaceae bacterium]
MDMTSNRPTPTRAQLERENRELRAERDFLTRHSKLRLDAENRALRVDLQRARAAGARQS